MQTVSEDWKNAHRRTILNESFVEVSLDIADPDSLADASSSDNGAIYISNSSELTKRVDKSHVPYCTLEQNIWLLDGTRKAIPDKDYEDTCYIGDALSNDVCVFSDKMPVITVAFGEVFSNLIPGITITWSTTYGEFADNFIVTAYNGDNIVAEREVIGNRSVKSVVFLDINNYDRIVIRVKKWCLPLHRARVEEIFVGVNKVYSKTELFDYSHTQSVDPISTSLPKMEIKFSVENLNGEYNPYNESGMSKYLMERQEVKARYGLKRNDNTIEWIKGGTFYLSEWYAKQNGMTADFTARDLLEFMSATYYDNEFYEINSGSEVTPENLEIRHLSDLALAVWDKSELSKMNDEVKLVIDPWLDAITTTAPLPEDTLANCLQLIANAAECVLYQDRNGILHIGRVAMDNDTSCDTDYSIDSFNSYSKPEVTLSKPIKQIDVKVYTYSIKDNGLKTETSLVSKVVGTVGEIITIDNPLITDTEMANSVATWMATHLGHRMTLDSSWRADVRLDALDIVTSKNEYNSSRVRITDVEFKYNGAFRGTSKGKVI